MDVVTAEGSAAILLRFSDAVAELGDLGLRVHRSYWAAYTHVKRAFRRDGRTLLLLTDDHEVRVGRNYQPEVRAALPKAWIRARRRTMRGPVPGRNSFAGRNLLPEPPAWPAGQHCWQAETGIAATAPWDRWLGPG